MPKACSEKDCAMRWGHKGPHRDRDGKAWPPEAVEVERAQLREVEAGAIWRTLRLFGNTPVFACKGLMYGAGRGYVQAERCYLDGPANRLGFVFSLKALREHLVLSYCPFCGVRTLRGEAQCTLAEAQLALKEAGNALESVT